MTVPALTPLFDTFLDGVGPAPIQDMFADETEDRLPERSGTTGGEDERATPAAAATDEKAPIPGGGYLLEEPSEHKVFKHIDEAVLRQEGLAKNRDQEGKHWDRVKRGVPFSYIEKSEDQSVWEAKLPPGVEDRQQPIPNKVLDLANKQVSQILVDPPLPNPKPDGDSERNRGAVDLGGRFLRADGDAAGTNDMQLWREVLTLNRTRKSSFVFLWVDAQGGGWRPKQKLAHPRATDPANPLMGPAIDPKTKQPIVGSDGQPTLERTTDPVLRYIAEDEAAGVEVFTEHAAEAAREWLPKHRRLLIHPNQIRTFPRRATAFEADAIVVLMWDSLGEAKKRFPLLAELTPPQLKQLTQWKPKRWKAIVPEAQRPKNDGHDASGDVTDDTLVFWYHKFCRICPKYPDGAEVAVNGASIDGRRKGFVFRRDTLREDVELDDGTTVPVLMDPPIVQFLSILDVDTGDPMGMAPVSAYGGANEIRAHLYLSVLEDIDVRLHPNTYLTSESEVTKDDMNRRDGTPIDVLSKDHMPTFEQRPPMPNALMPMLENVEHDMDTAANLSQTAQALDSKYSESGEAKKVAISQAKVQLAQEWQGFTNGVTQYWKVKLQLAQARLKTPMLVKVAGENSAYKRKHFVGADLVGVSAVPLLPGTGTMMAPAEKAQYLAQGQGQGWLDKTEAGERFRSSMSDDLGLPASPHEEYIERCIADFCDGPPEGWLEAYDAAQQYPARLQQYQATLQQRVQAYVAQGVHPQMAQARAPQDVGPPPPQPPPPYTPFEPRPNDEEPIVARAHYEKLSRLVSTTEYSRQDPRWRTTVDQKYTAAAYAAGVQTVRQQQEAQAAAAKAEEAKQTAPKDPNAPPLYQEFIAGATKAVITKAQSLLATETAALAAAGRGEPVPGTEPPPATDPNEPDPTRTREIEHASTEAQRDREHEAAMADRTHAQRMEAEREKSAAAVGRELAKAERQSTRAAGNPLPAR